MRRITQKKHENNLNQQHFHRCAEEGAQDDEEAPTAGKSTEKSAKSRVGVEEKKGEEEEETRG